MTIYKEALFACLSDFCRVYEEWENHHLFPNTKKRRRSGKLSLSEMLFIMVFFHVSGFRCFKLYYLYGVCCHYRNLFGELPGYGRFLLPCNHACSCRFVCCYIRRISRNKTFEGLAARGRTTMSWFYGFRLQVVINNKGEMIAIKITAGNMDDRAVLETMTKT